MRPLSKTRLGLWLLRLLRLLLAVAAEKELYLHQMDVSNAYLNSKFNEIVYMKQPEYFVGDQHPNPVLKFNKAIYGLKQSGKAWNSTLNDTLKGLGFEATKTKPCMYKKISQNSYNLIAIYVDDIIIACSKKSDMDNIKKKLHENFDIHDNGLLHHFLGMEIQRQGERGTICVC